MVKGFNLVLGGRVDSHDLWGTKFNPKASLLVRLSDEFRLKASVGRSFRGPKLVKLYANYRMGPFQVTPNPDLLPETSIGYQFGASWSPSEIFQAEISLFYNDISNLIQAVYSRGGRPPWPMTWENVTNAMTRGVEVAVKTSPVRHFLIKTGYTYLDTEDMDTGEDLLERPRNALFLTSMYQISAIGADVSLNIAYNGKRFAETDAGLEELDPYTTIDFSASKKIFKFGRLFVRVYNLLDVQDIYDEYNLYGTRVLGGLELGF
jgi:outer membrane receptor for ferrienterochelin and colicin